MVVSVRGKRSGRKGRQARAGNGSGRRGGGALRLSEKTFYRLLPVFALLAALIILCVLPGNSRGGRAGDGMREKVTLSAYTADYTVTPYAPAEDGETGAPGRSPEQAAAAPFAEDAAGTSGTGGGEQWVPLTADPQIVLDGCADWACLELFLAEPLGEDCIVTVYESDSGVFDRFHARERYAAKGTELIRIPARGRSFLRVDICAPFVLRKAEAVLIDAGSAAGTAGFPWNRDPVRLLWLWAGFAGALFSVGDYVKAKRKKNGKGKSSEEGKARAAAEEQGRNPAEGKAGPAAPRHYLWMDAARALAALLVIVIHVLEPMALTMDRGSKRWVLTQVFCIISLNANLLFVLLSGALLLPWREEPFPVYLKRRVTRVVIPLLVYACFYVFDMSVSAGDFPFHAGTYARQVSGNAVFMGPHFRLIYVIVSLYLLAWFLRFLLKSMGEREEKALAVMIVTLRLVLTAAYVTGTRVGLDLYLAEWPGMLLMGYLLLRPWMRKYDPAVIAAGAVSFAFSLWLMTERVNYTDYISNCSAVMLGMSSAIFVLLFRAEPLLRRMETGAGRLFLRLTQAVSSRSYSILLIHFCVIHAVLHDGVLPAFLGRSQALEAAAAIVLCLLISWAAAWVTDRSFVRLAEQAAVTRITVQR